ncbi:hypothetical protein N9Q26_00385 [bacterium]|jgi:hypothetical protein|nr:hypothetical protein [bacterium]
MNDQNNTTPQKVTVNLQEFFDKHKNDKNLSGKNLIIPKTEIKNHFSGWSVPKELKEIIDEKYEEIVFGFRGSIIVLKDGSIISNYSSTSKFKGEIFSYDDVLKFTLKEKGFTSKGTILFNGIKIGNVIGGSPDVGYRMFKDFQNFLNPIENNIPVLKEETTSELIRIILKDTVGVWCFEFKSDSIQFYELNEIWDHNHNGQQYSIENFDGYYEKETKDYKNYFKIKDGVLFNTSVYDDNSESTSKVSDFFMKSKSIRFKDEDVEYLDILHKEIFDDGSGRNDGSIGLHLETTELVKVEKIVYLFNHITSHNDLVSLESSYLNHRNELLNKRSSLIQELDVDGNGIIDISENNDFSKLLKIKQKLIVELEKSEGNNYIQNFVKLSKYLKTKSENIQTLFEIISNDSKISNEYYEEYVGVLKNQINTYNMMLITSLNMVISFCNDDRITFYEIYETFDKLNVFSSNHEREISMGLKNIESKLDEVVQSIYQMEMNICSELYNLQFITEDISDSLSGLSQGLSEINSSIQTNNLLTGIQTYQMYKINKNTKGLRE